MVDQDKGLVTGIDTATPEGRPIFVVESSPHVHSGESVRAIMMSVIIALMPATLVGIYLFGLPALNVIIICVAAAVAGEYIFVRLRGYPMTIIDGSAAVTGLLLALNLPPRSPLWMAGLGAVFGIIVAKQIYGGLGYNSFNPALIARVALLIAFPLQMTAQWYNPAPLFSSVDAVTSATPLGLLDQHLMDKLASYNYLTLFLGNKNGCIGEVSILALLIGAAFLLYRRIITWHIPVSFMATVFIITGAAWLINPKDYVSPVFHVLSGGLMIGAFFMATDMVTTPMTPIGHVIFGVGCGIMTSLIRLVPGGFPEGVSFGILLMNAVTPLIDRYTRPKVLGQQKPVKQPKEKMP